MIPYSWFRWGIISSFLISCFASLTMGINQIPNELLVEIDPARSTKLLPLLNATFGNKIQIKPVILRSMGVSLLHIKSKNESELTSIIQALTQSQDLGIHQFQRNYSYSLFRPAVLDTIELIHPTESSSIFYVPNDPYLTDASGQMNLVNNQGSIVTLYGHNRIVNAVNAWDYTLGSPSVSIAVIDTGAQLSHVELLNRAWINQNEIPNDAIDNDLNGFINDYNGWNSATNSHDLNDDNGHGSHVSGIALGNINNGFGSAGVCPSCRLMVIKANQPNEGAFSTLSLITGIDYAVLNGAKVINMSLGGVTLGELNANDSLYELAVRAADANGVVVVAAAGNESLNIDGNLRVIPATFPNVVAVSSTKGSVFDSSYSNFGNSIDVAAPGTNIISVSPSINSNTNFVLMRGTSMAAPVVAGAFGLLYSKAPYMTTSNATALIRKTSTDKGTPGFDPYYGYGLLNIGATIQTLHQDATPPNVTFLSNLTINKGSVSHVSYKIIDAVTPLCLVRMTANYYENGVLTQQIALPITGVQPTLTVSLHPSANTTLVSIVGSAMDVMGNTNAFTTFLSTGDLVGPTIQWDATSTASMLSGMIQFNITDLSGVNWNSLHTIWTLHHGAIIRDMAVSPATFSQSGPTLSVTLSGYGVSIEPSLFHAISTFSISIRDQVNNLSTLVFELGSPSPPTITWVSVPKELSDTTVLTAHISDSNGIDPTRLSATIQTRQNTRRLTLQQNPSLLAYSPPFLTLTLSDLLMESMADISMSASDWLDHRSTASITLKNNGGLTMPISGGYHTLIFPNPFNPSIGPSPRLAYALRRASNRGTLTLVNTNRAVISKLNLIGKELMPGYQEVLLSPLGVENLGNGIYMLILELWSDGEYRVHRQRFAVLDIGG